MTELKTFNEFHKDYVGGELGEEESNYDQYAFALRREIIKIFHSVTKDLDSKEKGVFDSLADKEKGLRIFRF